MQILRNTFNNSLQAILEWRYQGVRAKAYWQDRQQRHHHITLSEADFRQSRTSDTLFVFGSGYSLHHITPEGWAHIAEHNTLGFSWFVYQDFIRTDYQIIREIHSEVFDRDIWLPEYQRYGKAVRENPHLKDTILLAQQGWKAFGANRLIGMGLLGKRRKLLRFHNIPYSPDQPYPTTRLADGVLHHLGTLSDAINFGVIGGWRQIVLVGVDLYDRRYFWLEGDEPDPSDHKHYVQEVTDENGKVQRIKKAVTIETNHNTALNGVVPFMGLWHDYLSQQGITLSCYNPRSLLTQVMPVYEPTMMKWE